MAFFSGGLAFNSDGSLQVNADTVTTLYAVRLPADSLGKVWIDSANTPTAASTRLGGLAFTVTGALFCTTAAVSASSVRDGGIARTALGALHITYLPPARKFFVGGFCCDTDGVVFVSAADGDVAFYLPFTDLGAGVVSTVESITGATATFTRATSRTTVLSTGLIGTVASGSPASYYDPTSLAYLGYLAEGARTNLALRSAEFDDAAWSKTDTTITANALTSPDGTANADLWTQGVVGTASVIQTMTITADANVSVAGWFKRGNSDFVEITIFETAASTNIVRAWFNLNTGVVGTVNAGGTAAAVSNNIKAYQNGWYRVGFIGSVGNGATAVTVGGFIPTGDAVTTRQANGTVNAFGFQVENNVAFASTYIPTTTASVTRNADVLTYAFTPNQATGTLYAQFQVFSVVAINRYVASLSDGTTNEMVAVLNSTALMSEIVLDGGVTQANITSASGSANSVTKLSGAYAANDFATSMNGAAVATDTSGTLPTTTMVVVGADGASGQQTFGSISRVAYWRSRIINSGLQSMTG